VPHLDASAMECQAHNVVGMRLDTLRSLFSDLGEATYRADQAFEGIHRHAWRSWAQSTNLPKALRARLDEELPIRRPVAVVSLASRDGSTKHVLQLADGSEIECVHMPSADRATLCISSQVGCRMGCAFCATGKMGFSRNLASAEIVGQVMTMVMFHRHPPQFPLNIVFMGMGEPLDNLGEVTAAFKTLAEPRGMAISKHRVTISTAGLPQGIEQLGRGNPRPRLALSLNATTDEARSRIMPINKTWGLKDLADALRRFPLEKGERITLEYVAIKGISDSMDDAVRLANFAGQFPSKINIIPINPCPGLEYLPPSETRLNEMGAHLAKNGHIVSIRRSRGQDVGGACGQLASMSFSP